MSYPLFALKAFPELAFGGYSRVDGTVAFYSRVNALLSPDVVVADIGCGRGAYAEDPVLYRRSLRVLKGKVARVIGADVDPDASVNPFLDEYRSIVGSKLPFEDSSVDVLLADYVLEHVEAPGPFLSEVARVLRPGGTFCFRTPNRLGYPALIAQVIPNRLHARLATRVQLGREARDVFPTFYRLNTVAACRKYCAMAGLDGVVFGHEPEPAYLSFSRFAYSLGLAYSAMAPEALRTNLFGFFKKPLT